jgi:hypothetical protein
LGAKTHIGGFDNAADNAQLTQLVGMLKAFLAADI